MLGKLHLMVELWAGSDDIIISKWRHMKDTGAIGLDMSIYYADIIGGALKTQVQHFVGENVAWEKVTTN